MAHSPGPPAERAANGWFFASQAFAAAPANGAFLLRLLGRQGSGGFLPLWGGPPARFGDFPAVESHAGVRGRSARGHPHRRLISTPACRHSPDLLVLSTGRKYPKPAGAFRSAISA